MDVVYLVRPGDDNQELRYSLRSLRNLPHNRVWVAGYKPSWVTNVGYVESPQHWSKYVNSTKNLLAACDHPAISGRFALFNDDFFVLQPVCEVPTLHRGPVADVVADYNRRHGPTKMSDHYRQGMVSTARILERWGCEKPLSYELHVPMVVEGAVMAEAVRKAIEMDRRIVALHKRTLYGNVAGIGGEQSADVKILGRDRMWPEGSTFVSTEDESFRNGAVGEAIRSLFPDPSPYER